MKKNSPVYKEQNARAFWKIFLNWKWIGGLGVVGLLIWITPSPDIEKLATAPSWVSQNIDTGSGTQSAISLFVADKNHTGLKRLDTTIDTGATLEEKVYGALEALFTEEAALSSLFPPDMSVREVFLYDNTAVISLGGDFRRRFKGGAWTEMLAVYSMVNTVVESFEQINGMRILVDDKEADFFVSHVNITRTFTPDFYYVLEEEVVVEEVEPKT